MLNGDIVRYLKSGITGIPSNSLSSVSPCNWNVFNVLNALVEGRFPSGEVGVETGGFNLLEIGEVGSGKV